MRRIGNTESGVDQFVLERTVNDVYPEQFMKLLQVQKEFVKANKRCKSFEMLGVEEQRDVKSQVEIFATYVKSPSFLVSDRVFIDSKFLWNEEFVSISTGLGLDAFRREYVISHNQ